MGARERYLLAELLAKHGHPEEALTWYRTLDGVWPSDFPYVGPAHLGRAEVLTELGRTEKTIREYRQFLDLRQDADSILQPRVKEAREALAQLSRDTMRAPSSAGSGSDSR